MKAQVRRKIEMGVRVRGFLQAHPSEEASYTIALSRFEEVLTRAETLAAQQRAGLIDARAATERRKEVRQLLHFQLLPHLVRVGELAAKDRAELARHFQLPGIHVTHLAFLTAAKAMLAEAESQKDLLVSLGMSDKLLDALKKAVSEFEAANERGTTGRRDHIGARSELDTIGNEIVEQVRSLDALVRFQFGDQPELMGSWNSARNVVGPSKGKVAPPPAGDGVVPPTPGDIAPAA